MLRVIRPSYGGRRGPPSASGAATRRGVGRSPGHRGSIRRSIRLLALAVTAALAACDSDPAGPEGPPASSSSIKPTERPLAVVTVVPGSVATQQAVGVAPGFEFAQMWGLNDDGVLVGQLCPSFLNRNGCVPAQWTDFVATPLPLPTGATAGTARAVNSSGVAVGSDYRVVTVAGATRHATRALRWRPGATAPDVLPTINPYLQDPLDAATDINDHGYVVGNASSAVIWSPSESNPTLTQLSLGANPGLSRANAINNGGVIVGNRWVSPYDLPVRWASSAVAAEDLPLPAGYFRGDAKDVADDGTVVGHAIGSAGSDAIVWRPGATQMEATVLPRLSPQYGCYATAISNSGAIVGSCVEGPVVWARGRVYRLAGGQQSGYASGISSSGLVSIDVNQAVAPYALQLIADPFVIAEPGDSYTGAEGAAVAFDGTASSSWPVGSELSYAWSFGDGTTSTDPAPTHTYADNGTYAVTLQVSTGSGLPSPVMRTTATISNVAPTVNAGADASIEPGRSFTLGGTFSDPGTSDNPWSYTINWGDGSAATTGSRTSQGAISVAKTYSNPGTYTVRLTVRDKSGAAGFDELVLTVRSLSPTARPGGPYVGVEGTAVALNGSASADPAGNGLTYSWSFGDGTTGTGATPQHTYADDGTYTVTLTVDAGNGRTHTATTTATIADVPPRITGITLPAAPVPLGTAVSAQTAFTGAAVDQFGAVVSWDDGTTSTLPGVASGFAATHTYATPGVYTVRVRVTDSDGSVDEQAAVGYVVVYDPSTGSFVTGSGSIDSPAGAMPASPTVSGRASFGFQSRYMHGASTPSGFTRFEFRVGGLEFEATRFDWLVVAGTKAQFKGEGTIAGRAGTFQFIVSAVDDGPGGDDRFRIKITDASGAVVYDNQLGASDGAQPATTITSGNITVKS